MEIKLAIRVGDHLKGWTGCFVSVFVCSFVYLFVLRYFSSFTKTIPITIGGAPEAQVYYCVKDVALTGRR